METDATPQWNMNAREIVQALPSLAVGFTVVCFSVGLLIVDLSLARYGIFSSELIRSEYVTAGALFIFLVALMQLSLSYGLKDIESAAPRWREGGRIASVFIVIFGLFEILCGPTLALNFMSDGKLDVGKSETWIVIGIMVNASILSSVLLERSIELWKGIQVPLTTESIETTSLFRLRRILGLVLFNYLAITMYAYYAYPYLSPAIGGGRREQVMLLATEQGIAVSKSLSLPVQIGTQLIGPLQLLTETDSEIIVAFEPNESMKFRALRLQRNMFEAMFTAPAKK